MPKIMYRIEAVIYNGQGVNIVEYGKKIEASVGAASDAGFGFDARDLGWYRKTKQAADKLFHQIKRFKKARVSIEIEKEDID